MPPKIERTLVATARVACVLIVARVMSGPSQAPGRYKAFRPSSAHAPSFKRSLASDGASE